MAIDVTCPGCKTRFQVSDKFAGKKGPCPKCKVVILVPKKEDEVVIHAPEQTGPKDSKGVAVLKPLTRIETVLSPLAIGSIVGAIVTTLLVALMLRVSAPTPGNIPGFITALGAIILAPPLAFAGYTFLREQELEPFRGKDLILHLIAPSVVYPLLWGIYWAVFAYLNLDASTFNVGLVGALMAFFAAGTFCAFASLDLEVIPAALHYGLYLATTVLLRVIMGMSAFWQDPPKL
jgi:hypothetical protein